MNIGAFSVSLAVKDINASKAFYEKLGFQMFAGELSQNWLILKNGYATIGLFQGMFENNILTFNPGWDSDANEQQEFTDIRDIQKELSAEGLALIDPADEESEGPGSFLVVDPDGNTILFDQHI